MFKDKKGQGALEYLLIIAGVIIIAIIVIYIIITTGSSNRDKVDVTEERMTRIIDSAIFPPRIKKINCTRPINSNIVTFNVDIFESPTPSINTYCLFLFNTDVNLCKKHSNAQLSYDYNVLTFVLSAGRDTNYYDVSLVSSLYENTISNQSVTSRCVLKW